MPPVLALTLCTIFVLFLLRLDHKQYPEASAALWIPTISILLALSKPLGIWFGIGGIDMEEGSPLDRNIRVILLLMGFLILLKRQFNWTKAITKNPWLIILIGFSLVSILWSDMPYSSFKRWIRASIAIVMVFIVATEVDSKEALKCLFRRIVYILIPYSLMLIKYYPHLGVTYGRWSGALMWIGVASQKNGLAHLCLIAFVFLIWTFIQRRKKRDLPVIWYQTYVEIFLFLLTIWLFTGPTHILTYSATSTAALAVGLFFLTGMLWLKKRNILIGKNTLTIIIVFIIFYGTITPFVGGFTLIDPSTLLGREETLTGRADIWAILAPYALNKPVLGYGFGGFWNDAMRAMTSSHAHNGYLDAILNTGFVGLILLSICLVFITRRVQEEMSRDFDWCALWFCFLVIAVVHNIAESSLTSFASFSFVMLLYFDIPFNIKYFRDNSLSDMTKRNKYEMF